MFKIVRTAKINETMTYINRLKSALEARKIQHDVCLKRLDLCEQSQAALLHELQQVQKTSKSRMAKINKQKAYIEKLKIT